jgi:hypothetical protein
MADLSKIKLPSGTSYNLKDAQARADIETIKSSITGGMHYIGVTTTALTDGSTTNPITIDTKSVTAESGDIAIYGKKEFIFSDTDSSWHEFGDMGSLKSLAFKDSASGSYTPSGTISNTVTVGTSTVNSTFTPKGSVSITMADSGTANYTPTGTVSTPTITVKTSNATKYVATSASGGGSVTAGSAASCTLPTFSTSVSDETLTLNWTSGSFSTNTPTKVTLPTFSSQSIATGISSATSSKPTFTGTGAVLQADFTGTQDSATGSVTPSVKVSSSFTGSSSTVTVS